MILEGWRHAISAEQYAAVQYDCASAAVATKIRRLAKKAQLSPPEVIAVAQRTGEEIRAIAPDPEVGEPAPRHQTSKHAPGVGDDPPDERALRLVPAAPPASTIREAPDWAGAG